MAITKPTVGQSGWNTAVDATIDRVNAHDANPLVTGFNATGAAIGDVVAFTQVTPSATFAKRTLAAVATSGSASDLTIGTLPDAVIPGAIARDAEVSASVSSAVASLTSTALAFSLMEP